MDHTKRPDQHDNHPSKQKTDPVESAAGTDEEQLLRDLQQLDPPFDNAGPWLRRTSPALVRAWLDHLQGMDRDRRRHIRNEAAFLHAKVAAGRSPPPPDRRTHRLRRQPCPRCGKTYRDRYGRCLVCAGVVTV